MVTKFEYLNGLNSILFLNFNIKYYKLIQYYNIFFYNLFLEILLLSLNNSSIILVHTHN